MKVYTLIVMFLTTCTFSQEKQERVLIGSGFGIGVTYWQTTAQVPSSSYDGGGISFPIEFQAIYCTKWIRWALELVMRNFLLTP